MLVITVITADQRKHYQAKTRWGLCKHRSTKMSFIL